MACRCKPQYKNVTHVIFDLDGTLIDSETVYCEIFSILASKYGKTFTSDIHNLTTGLPEQKTLQTIIEKLELPVSINKFRQQFIELQKEKMNNVNLLPGAENLIRHLKRHKIPMAIATSSCYESFQQKTVNHKELFSLIHHVVCGDDSQLKNSKPAPDIYLLAAKRFFPPVNPENCLVFEDSPTGMKSGLAAKMQVVLVPDSSVPKDIWKLATIKINSLEEIKLELFGLQKL